MSAEACVFCDIVAGTAPAKIVHEWPDAIAFVPLGPVVDGHVLVVPRQHVADAVEDPAVTAMTMARAAELAAEHEASNILTSIGRPATQSVFHLHIHVIRREAGDQLMVPWGTTGNPHDPHACKRSTQAESAIERVRDLLPYLDGQITGLEGIRPIVGSGFRHTYNNILAAIGQPEASPVSFTCPACGKTSYNPNDAREGYCGACHAFTGRSGHCPPPASG